MEEDVMKVFLLTEWVLDLKGLLRKVFPEKRKSRAKHHFLIAVLKKIFFLSFQKI